MIISIYEWSGIKGKCLLIKFIKIKTHSILLEFTKGKFLKYNFLFR
jgi:hypothetical protein